MESNNTPKKAQIDKDAKALKDIITKTWNNNKKKKVTISAKRKKRTDYRMGR